MAAVSAPQATGSALTPPTSSHSNWDYAVPASSQDYAYSSKEPLPSDNSNDRRHMAPIANGSRARPARSNSHDQPTHLAPTRVNDLNSKNSPVNGTSPADSLLDLYSNSNKSGSTSLHDGERSAVGNKRTPVAMLDEDDPGWIHRDKLARIESRELQAAGIILPRNRAYSKTGAGRSNRSRETSATGLGQRTERSQQRRPQVDGARPSHQSHPEEEDRELEDERADDKTAWDLRTPEEIEEDNLNTTYYHERSQLSKGASKIPLAMQSRIPVPLDFIERPIPAQRTKSTTWGSDGEGGRIEYPKPKEKEHVRAASEEPVALQPATAEVKLPPPKGARDSGSGPGKRNTQSATHSPMKNTPGTTVRKSNTTKTPPLSNTRDFNGRPKTRSGSQSLSRPVTRGTGEVKRPEGDPPWLATMFKPDPRLPPDQQLLPTVAKRLAQENWEKEGKFGNVYDTNFRPLNADELRRQELPPSPTKPQLDVEIMKDGQRGQSGEWPLKNPDREGRPGTAGGYSTMPKISTQPPMNQAPVILPNPPKVEQMQEEQPKKKGGCGCCIVM